MNPRICQDIFAISILIHVACDFTIDKDDKLKEFHAVLGRSYNFTVGFIYITGTDYDSGHVNFGFSSEYPEKADPLMVLMNGVSISGEQFLPPTPDVTNPPNAMQIGTYSAALAFPSVQAVFDTLLTLGVSGFARINPTFGGILKYNQGKA